MRVSYGEFIGEAITLYSKKKYPSGMGLLVVNFLCLSYQNICNYLL